LLLSSPISETACGLAYRRAKLPEVADQKTMMLRKTPSKLKMFYSSISPSGLLERFVRIILLLGKK
jgi:hypothetical protein